ncbi:MAG TPA: hypothetical protein V6C69_07785, partial [Trichormus sp.]
LLQHLHVVRQLIYVDCHIHLSCHLNTLLQPGNEFRLTRAGPHVKPPQGIFKRYRDDCRCIKRPV